MPRAVGVAVAVEAVGVAAQAVLTMSAQPSNLKKVLIQKRIQPRARHIVVAAVVQVQME
ncbi:unannotated protein [freshwater metagenome]|uniref:Unannotated protein n=1 Tax=freshwater metagenome TaxID=449393 RepID=A0A6J7B9L3_9ZZZZ